MTQAIPSETYRSGYVALVGRPNVGKSTLLNAYLGQKLAAVSSRPQTTRLQQLAILSLDQAQIIFVDTPGLHQPHHKLGERMNEVALAALEDADLVLVMFDASEDPTDEDERVVKALKQTAADQPKLAVLNKVDLSDAETLAERQAAFERLLRDVPLLAVSATRGDHREDLLDRIIAILPEGPQYYNPETTTDLYEREIAADWIRAACLELLQQEVPYSIAVRIDEYKERGETGAYIAATLFVERDSQKGIVIGKRGAMLRKIGMMARAQIEAMSGRKVYLDLRVKTLPGWRNDDGVLSRFGFGAKA